MSIIIKELIIKSIVYEGRRDDRNPAAIDRSALKREIAKMCGKIVDEKFRKIKER
ncbi:MAG: hypothetical protein KDD04_03820 [Sinomicrobium sp.]|nr:hypothetical protein [Sinomicrobium sp.]